MDGVLRISQAARQLGISVDFLREGEKKGKIPKAKRDINQWRVYTGEDLQFLRGLLVPSLEDEEFGKPAETATEN